MKNTHASFYRTLSPYFKKTGKNLLSALSAVVLAAMLMSSCSSQSEGWKLVWAEEFNGETIDEQSWSRIGRGLSDWDDMMSQRPDLAYIDNGQLVLLGKVNEDTLADTTPFVTGGVWSHHKKSFRLARFEVRAKFNSVQGFWPALWLMPDVSLPQPEYAEIDIMEHVNFETVAHQTVHSHYTLHINDPEKGAHSASAEIKPDDWNTYAAEVHADSICFFVNDKKTFTYPRVSEKEYQFPWPDYPFYIILSNQLGGKWVGAVSEPSQLPSELRIDWVRVYQKQEK